MSKVVFAVLVGFDILPFEIRAAAARAFFSNGLEEVHTEIGIKVKESVGLAGLKIMV